MFKTADPILYSLLRQYARDNRKNMTLGESLLWEAIRQNGLGVKFLRQHVIGEFIVDFACLEHQLVIEVDGGYHSEPRQQESDVVKHGWSITVSPSCDSRMSRWSSTSPPSWSPSCAHFPNDEIKRISFSPLLIKRSGGESFN